VDRHRRPAPLALRGPAPPSPSWIQQLNPAIYIGRVAQAVEGFAPRPSW